MYINTVKSQNHLVEQIARDVNIVNIMAPWMWSFKLNTNT